MLIENVFMIGSLLQSILSLQVWLRVAEIVFEFDVN